MTRKLLVALLGDSDEATAVPALAVIHCFRAFYVDGLVALFGDLSSFPLVFYFSFSRFMIYSRLAIFSLVSCRLSRSVLLELNSSMVTRFTLPSVKNLS